MLLRTLFILAMIATLAETVVHAAHALAQISLRRQASLAARHELQSGIAAARESVADAIVAGGDPRSLEVSPVPSGDVTISFEPAATVSPSPCASDGCTIYEQGNDAVREGRITATIVSPARTTRVTFRTIAVPPYATVAGVDDADDKGAAPNGAAPGTLVDVLYENRVTGATFSGNVWHSQIERPGSLAPAWIP